MDGKAQRNWQRAQELYSQGDLDGARAKCESVLSREPRYPPAHWMLSCIQQSRRRMRDAIGHARKAGAGLASLPPERACLVTRQLISVGDYEAAAEGLARTAARASGADPVLVEVAEQLSLVEEHAAALACLDRAAKAGLRLPALSYLRGNMLKFLGELDASERAYEEALAQSPLFPHAHWSLAYLGLRQGAEARAARVRAALSQVPANDLGANATLGYALFKELDSLDRVDAAWEALATAMAHRRRQVQYSAAEESAVHERLMQTWTPEFMTGGEPDPRAPVPIFIVGMPRTGTTLLERVLGNHPRVRVCGELNDMRMAYKAATDYYCPSFLDAEAANRMAAVDARALGEDYLQRTRWRRAPAQWFSDKHQGNFVFTGLLLRALPQARIIHLRRNAMDSCFSNLKELFGPQSYGYSYSLPEVAAHYRNYTRLMRHVAEALPGRVLELDYESLVQEPEREAARVLAYCGLDAVEGVADIGANTSAVSTASSAQVRQAIHGGYVEAWKRYAEPLAPLAEMLAGA